MNDFFYKMYSFDGGRYCGQGLTVSLLRVFCKGEKTSLETFLETLTVGNLIFCLDTS